MLTLVKNYDIYQSSSADHEMNEIIEQTGVGIESIEFSIADNLDHLNDSIGSYRERLKFMDCRGLTLHGPFMNIDPAAF